MRKKASTEPADPKHCSALAAETAWNPDSHTAVTKLRMFYVLGDLQLALSLARPAHKLINSSVFKL